MEKWKEENGCFKHFEMKGGTYSGFLKNINELIVQACRCYDSLREMDCQDINGTPLAVAALGHIQHKLERLCENMEEYREEQFK